MLRAREHGRDDPPQHLTKPRRRRVPDLTPDGLVAAGDKEPERAVEMSLRSETDVARNSVRNGERRRTHRATWYDARQMQKGANHLPDAVDRMSVAKKRYWDEKYAYMIRERFGHLTVLARAPNYRSPSGRSRAIMWFVGATVATRRFAMERRSALVGPPTAAASAAATYSRLSDAHSA